MDWLCLEQDCSYIAFWWAKFSSFHALCGSILIGTHCNVYYMYIELRLSKTFNTTGSVRFLCWKRFDWIKGTYGHIWPAYQSSFPLLSIPQWTLRLLWMEQSPVSNWLQITWKERFENLCQHNLNINKKRWRQCRPGLIKFSTAINMNNGMYHY